MNGLKTYTGLGILAIPAIAHVFFDVEITETEATQAVTAITTVVGSIITGIGLIHKLYKKITGEK